MLEGFKKFVLRGNVVDLAVGVVVGAAFGTVVNSLVTDLLNPFIGALVKIPNFNEWNFVLNDSKFMIGSFLNHTISFLLTVTAVYFFVVLPLNTLMMKVKKEPSVDPTNKKCPECFSEIHIEATRCPFCTTTIMKK